MVGNGGKAAVGGCTDVVIKRIPLFAACTGMEKMMMMNDVMVNDDAVLLRDFLL